MPFCEGPQAASRTVSYLLRGAAQMWIHEVFDKADVASQKSQPSVKNIDEHDTTHKSEERYQEP